MKQRRFIVPVFAFLYAAVCFGQNGRPGPDPVQRAVTQARNAGQLADAEKLLRDAIHDLENGDPKSPRLSSYLKQLSGLVTRRGDTAEAAALFQQAYELDLSMFGPDDLRMTSDIANLAWAAHNAGDHQKAEQLFNRALDIVHSNEGSVRTMSEAGMAAGLLGSVVSYYMLQKRWVEAEVLLQKEIRLCNQLSTPGREGFGDCGNLPAVLSEIYRGEGREAEAARLPPDSIFPAELEALNKSAGKFMDDGLYPSAEDAYNRAIALARKLDVDPQSRFNGSLTIREIDSLGRLYEKEGAKDKAEQSYLTVQEMTEKRAGSEPSQMGFAMSLTSINLVNLYRNEGRFKDAEAVLQRGLDLEVKYLGERNRAVVNTLMTLAGVYEQEGQKDEEQYAPARAAYERALSIQESMVGLSHPQLLPVLRQYAQLLVTAHDTANTAKVRARIDAITALDPNGSR
jgi:tetratricopeptide (TPR) repeat protein